MKKIDIIINGKKIKADAGSTILQTAQKYGISIPTLCHKDDLKPVTSCMLCVVYEKNSGRLLPSCSYPVSENMDIETDSEKVITARTQALELLACEHTGDCIAPCQQACPAHMNIPQMMHLLQAEKWKQSLNIIRETIAIPGILGRICPAPCEKACRRNQMDRALAICKLKGYSAEINFNTPEFTPVSAAEKSGKKCAVIGSGPAGLSAAFYLSRLGHSCTIFDKEAEPGGTLRNGISRDMLPLSVLESEINVIKRMGVAFQMNCRPEKTQFLDQLKREYDAVCLASGNPEGNWNLENEKNHVWIDPVNGMTSVYGIFACGNMIFKSRLAVRAAADGRRAAMDIHRFLTGEQEEKPPRFRTHIGKLTEHEIETLQNIKSAQKFTDAFLNSPVDKLEAETVKDEAGRCLHCECLKPDTCRLRIYGEMYNARSAHFSHADRPAWEKIEDHPYVIFEPGKCVKCGICVRITQNSKEALGLTFIGRGFDCKVAVPLSRSLAEGLKKTAEECALACPTGALALKG